MGCQTDKLASLEVFRWLTSRIYWGTRICMYDWRMWMLLGKRIHRSCVRTTLQVWYVSLSKYILFSPFSSPSLPLLFLPSLLRFTVRKGHLWRSNSVQPGTDTDGRQQQLQQWVNLQSRKSLKRYCFMCMWKVQEFCNGLWEEGWRRFVDPSSIWLQQFSGF